MPAKTKGMNNALSTKTFSYMNLRHILMSALIVTSIYSCKKNQSDTPATTNDDICAQADNVIDNRIIAGQYIVAYNNQILSRDAGDLSVESVNRSVLNRHEISSNAIMSRFEGDDASGFIARLSAEEVARLKTDAMVQTIEPDRIIKLGTCFTVAEPRLITWNIQRVGYGNGIGKTAWIIDSGIDTDHPDLTVDQTRSRSFITGQTSFDDENGHGTHVAGIIGAKNNTIGVLGVASGATLVSLRVLNKDGEGTLSSIIQALSYVNSNAKAGDVVNMSLGEDTLSTILDQQVKATASRGILIAIAAGNDHKPAKNFSPAAANGANIYTVSAIDSLDRFASFSNYGNEAVDFAAPGVKILSTYTNGRYAYLSGTSMAAPHVAGLLLLRGNAIRTSGYAVNDPDGTPDPIAHY